MKIGQYLSPLLVGSLLLSVCTMLCSSDTMKNNIRMVGSILLTLLLLRPICRMTPDTLLIYPEAVYREADAYTSAYESLSADAFRSGISQRLQEYIEQEAAQLGYAITAQVTLTDDNPPNVQEVYLTGNAPMSIQQLLAQKLCQALGLQKEQMKWIGQPSGSS